MKTQRHGRLRRRLWALLIGLASSFLFAEGGLRILLFWDTLTLERLARKLRQPGYYADMRRDDVYWKLQHIWTPRAERRPLGRFSPVTGWAGALIDHTKLTMQDEAAVGERRPVLLYGDSFAESVTSPEDAWQGLLERAPEGRTHALVNFGTSGYGTDQTLRMLEATVGRYAERNPLVIFSLFLDEDPDRTMLSFRGMPKPRFELEKGELVFRPLSETDANVWWDNHPPGVPSYLWRLFRGPAGPLPLAWQEALNPIATDAQVIALNRALITRMHRRLEALGIEHFVLGFHGRMMLENPGPYRWREQWVREICSELGVHFLASGPYLLAAVDSNREALGPHLFVTEGIGEGHYNARGNCAAFEAIRQALHGRYESEDTAGVKAALLANQHDPNLPQTSRLQALGRPARLSFHGDLRGRCLREVVDAEGPEIRALGLYPELELPTQVEWHIEQDARFVADVRAASLRFPDGIQEAVRLRVLVDGNTVRSLELSPGQPALRLEHELDAPCTFTLAVEPVDGYSRACWARLEQPAFR